jgi:tetratricopeptide (TPR) repeat protein
MEDTTGKYRLLGIYLLLAGITFVVYKPVLHHQFVNFDDDVYVTGNEDVKAGLTGQSILRAFEAPSAHFWHPLTMLSHTLDCELFDLKPAGHHLTNLLLHIANALLLFYVLKDMTGSTGSPQAGAVWKSALVSALFALHPLHVESVAWVSERKDVLSTLFWMLTMIGYVRYVRRPTAVRYSATLILFLLGLMAKPMLITLPFVLLLMDYWPLNRLQNKKDVYQLALEKAPFLVLSAAFSVVAFWAQRGEVELTLKWPVRIRIANAFISYFEYIEKMFWPAGLSVFYPHPEDKLSMLGAAIAFVILAGVSILAIYLSRRKYLLTGWLWYLGTLVPVIGFVQVGVFAMADRYTYISLTGLFIIIVWGADELLGGWRWRKIALGVSAPLVLLALSICTSIQLRYWQNSITLFEHSLKVTSNNYLAYNNFGFAYIELGRYKEAAEAFKEAIKIKGDYAEAHINLSLAYIELGRYNEAVEVCKEAIRIWLNYADAYCNLGTAYLGLGNNDAAIQACKEAINIEPNFADAHYNLGLAYVHLNRYDEAITAFKQAIQIKPDLAKAHYNLGLAYGLVGRYDEGITALRQAIQIKPDYPEPYYNLGVIYGRVGRYNEAITVFQKAIKIKPDYAEAYYNLGLAYKKLGSSKEAITAFKEAIHTKPDYATAYYNLGLVYLTAGDTESAMSEYKILKDLDRSRAEELFKLINK